MSLLEEFHSIGYVHNDIKPENICFGRYPETSSLADMKLVDFGFASPYL